MKNKSEKFGLLIEYLVTNSYVKNQVSLAELLGTNKQGVTDIKNGKKRMSYENIVLLKKTFPDVPVDDILSGDQLAGSIVNEPPAKYGTDYKKLYDESQKEIMRLQKKVIKLQDQIIDQANRMSSCDFADEKPAASG